MISNYNLISHFGSGLYLFSASGDFVFCVSICEYVCPLIPATMDTAWSVDRHRSERPLASPSCFLCMGTLAISQIPTLPARLPVCVNRLTSTPENVAIIKITSQHEVRLWCLCHDCLYSLTWCFVLCLEEFGWFGTAHHVSRVLLGPVSEDFFLVLCQTSTVSC